MNTVKIKDINQTSDISIEERLKNMEQMLISIKKEVDRIGKAYQPIIKN